MTAGGDFYTRIAHPTEIIELLETMSQPGSASLVPEQDQAAQLPVVVATASGDALHLDIGCGVFLATQIMKLRRGEYLDQKVLSQQSAKLLALHAEDREGLLFVLTCLHKEQPLIRHCLAVAARLMDIGTILGLQPAPRAPRRTVEALSSSA